MQTFQEYMVEGRIKNALSKIAQFSQQNIMDAILRYGSKMNTGQVNDVRRLVGQLYLKYGAEITVSQILQIL